ncbi:MAG: cupin domain-containing protein [Cocleimonas sp.]|nr:cupin domain-containing protein [Cocleimonas sp.]
MEKPKKQHALDNDVLEMLAEAHQAPALSAETTARMRNSLMAKIREKKKTGKQPFVTVRGGDEDWIEALPGAKIKILQGDFSVPNSLLSYLVRLEPNFKLAGHGHPFDEEILMLEGDLSLGETTLSKGDFHFALAGSTHGEVSTINGCLAYMRGALPV